MSQGWQQSSEVAQVDGLAAFKKASDCDISSLDIHHPFAPRCSSRHRLLEAMSGGGRLGWDEPYWSRDCDMQWFTADQICDVLSRFDHIYLVGDSMMRHLSQALHVLMRADLVNGGRATWRVDEEDTLGCQCRTVFNNPGCVWWSSVNTDDVLKGDPESIHCPRANTPLITWESLLNFPLDDGQLHNIFKKYPSKDSPTSRVAFIFGHGLWNDLEAETTISWLEQIESAMEAEMPAYFDAKLHPSKFPRLFVTPSAQGEGKPDIFHGAQNNIRLMRHTHEIATLVKQRGYEHLGLYNMSVQSSSPDGTHASLENNLLKAMMALNWLSMLEEPDQSKPQDGSFGWSNWKIKFPFAQSESATSALADSEVVAAPTTAETSALDMPATVTATAIVDTPIETAAPDFSAAEHIDSPMIEHVDDRPADHSSSHLGVADPVEHFDPASVEHIDSPAAAVLSSGSGAPTTHPIDRLLESADSFYEDFKTKQSTTVEKAAAAYREARGRHPPPRFDQWMKWCQEHNVIVVEDFFDQIYHDLAPFWAVDPAVMRNFSKTWMNVLSIRNGTIKRWDDEPKNIADWMSFWYNGMLRLPLKDLPDIDLAFNGEDEPKLFVPWETRQQALSKAEFDRHTHQHGTPVDDYATYEPLPKTRPNPETQTAYQWADFSSDDPLWLAGRETCPPDSEARQSAAHEDYSQSVHFPPPSNLAHMHDGFVGNWSQAKSCCANPHMRSLHGTWIGMLSSSIDNPTSGKKALLTNLYPLLSGCKIHDITSEILVPPAMQWPSPADDTDFTFNFKENKRIPWAAKHNTVMWRGSASGGVNDENNWTRFQRHRFLAMLNGTLVAEHLRIADEPLPLHVPGGTGGLPHNFPLPNNSVYHLGALSAADPGAAMQHWLDNYTDVGFVHLRCYPPPSWFTGNGQDCPYNGGFYTVKPMVNSIEAYRYKYQPDVDGASYSGRYRALLHSNSLPVKATIYDEWHDSRLVPWRHFVPMDNTFVDWWGVMEYFLGYDPAAVEGLSAKDVQQRERKSRDDVAERIAVQGAEWAKTVLRNEDMLAYMYRLVLEMARLYDDRRLDMGFVDDLKGGSSGGL